VRDSGEESFWPGLTAERVRGKLPLVVASAMAGETNRLVTLGNQIDPSYRGAAYDMLVASGEQVAIALVVIALEKLGVPARPLLAYQLGIETTARNYK
jgi:aspartate kinase